MTDREERIRAAAFEFTRKLRDPSFREAINATAGKLGKDATRNVVVALEDEHVSDVLQRVVERTQPPTLLAIKVASEPSGFGIINLAPVEADARTRQDAEAFRLGDDTSIGMFYTWAKERANASHDRQLKIPHSWFAVTAAA